MLSNFNQSYICKETYVTSTNLWWNLNKIQIKNWIMDDRHLSLQRKLKNHGEEKRREKEGLLDKKI